TVARTLPPARAGAEAHTQDRARSVAGTRGARCPWQFVRGLIQSDGCRVINRVNGGEYPRYLFSQVSDDIRKIFCEALDFIGVEWKQNRWNSISVARRQGVELLDSFIGPKA